MRLLEHAENFSSDTHLGVSEKTNLPANTCTQMAVTSAALNTGDRMIPQIFSTNQTDKTVNISYDDCSFTRIDVRAIRASRTQPQSSRGEHWSRR